MPTKLSATADDCKLKADGINATRVVFKLVDQAGNLIPYANESIQIEVVKLKLKAKAS